MFFANSMGRNWIGGNARFCFGRKSHRICNLSRSTLINYPRAKISALNLIFRRFYSNILVNCFLLKSDKKPQVVSSERQLGTLHVFSISIFSLLTQIYIFFRRCCGISKAFCSKLCRKVRLKFDKKGIQLSGMWKRRNEVNTKAASKKTTINNTESHTGKLPAADVCQMAQKYFEFACQ